MSIPSKIPTKDRETNRQIDEILGQHLKPQKMTTAQINALSNKDVVIVWDTTVGALKVWNGSAWKTITHT